MGEPIATLVRGVWNPRPVTSIAGNSAQKGDAGVHLITAIVDEMGHLWHPTVGVDSGIDGQIELRDPGTGEVRNVRIGVQSRANPSRWTRETERTFSYRPPPKELAYWLSSNQPVLLICSRPETGDIYWRSIQEWASDPSQRARGLVRFDKLKDRFDASVASALFDLSSVGSDRIEPPSPPHIQESLTTNLMPLHWHRTLLYSVAVPQSSNARQLFAPAWKEGIETPTSALRSGRLWALEPFEDEFVSAIGAGDQTEVSFSIEEVWDDIDQLNAIKELIVRSVASRDPRLAWHAQKRVLYFRRQSEHENVQLAWSKAAPRTVVFANFSQDDHRHFTGYRHDAATVTVRRLGEEMALQINPTYLFTWDGRQISGHHADALAGIKRIEKHRAASATLRMWEHILEDRADLFDARFDGCFSLKPLVLLTAPRSINERSWERLSDVDADEAQGSIFDVLEGA